MRDRISRGRRPFRTIAAALLMLGLTVGSVPAAERGAIHQGVKVVQDLSTSVDATVRDGSLSQTQRRQRLGHLLIARFDLEIMCRYLLSEHWASVSGGDRQEFRLLLGQYIIASFGRHFETAPRVTLHVMNMRPSGDSGLQVRSLLDLGGEAAPLDISWRLNRDGESWHIVDVVVRGFSLMALLRSEFTSIIESDDGHLNGLLARLREKTAAINAGA